MYDVLSMHPQRVQDLLTIGEAVEPYWDNEHEIKVYEWSYTIQHPIKCRIEHDNDLFDCPIQKWMQHEFEFTGETKSFSVRTVADFEENNG